MAGEASALSEFSSQFGGLATELAAKLSPVVDKECLRQLAQKALQACVDELPNAASSIVEGSVPLESWVGVVCGRFMHEVLSQSQFKLASQRFGELFPERMPDHEFFTLRAFCRAAEILSGDYYDVRRSDDGCVILLLADVMGHGAPAALLVSAVRCAFRLTDPGLEPVDVLLAMNSALMNVLPSSCFVAAGVIRLATDEPVAEYSNAGLEEASVVSKAMGELRKLELPGSLLALFEEVDFGQETLRLGSGDHFFVCSDGVFDVCDSKGERFGKEGLRQLLERSLTDTRDLDVLIQEALEQFGGPGPWPDDASFLIVRAK